MESWYGTKRAYNSILYVLGIKWIPGLRLLYGDGSEMVVAGWEKRMQEHWYYGGVNWSA